MSADSVRAILEGRKTQSRRVVKHQPCRSLPHTKTVGEGLHSLDIVHPLGWSWHPNGPNGWRAFAVDLADVLESMVQRCPYGRAGDRLWVKESWMQLYEADNEGGLTCLPPSFEPTRRALRRAKYRATDTAPANFAASWRGPLLMPRWASRLTLELTEVRVEPVQDLSEADARAEGMTLEALRGTVNGHPATVHAMSHVQRYIWEWDTLNAKRGFAWASNPWVWVLTFRRVEVVRG